MRKKFIEEYKKDFLDFKLNIEIVSACVLYFRDEDIFTCKKCLFSSTVRRAVSICICIWVGGGLK